MLEEVETTWSEFTNEKRWFLQFFVSILLCINNAACFCFGIFSPFMKLGGFRYSQSQLMTVSTVGVLLSYLSLPTGYLYDLKGPKATILVGTVLNVLGWFGMYCIFYDLEHPLWSNSVLVMCIFYGFSQLSASFYETGSVLTNLRSFNCYQGRVILIQKTFMGLGSSIVAQIYIAFFQLNITGIAPFFAFLFTFSAVSGILGVLFVSLPTESTRCVGLNVADPEIGPTGGETKLFSKPFNYGTVVLLVGVVYVLVVTLYENHADLSPAYRAFVGVSTVTLCLLFIGMTFLTPSYKVNVGGYRGDTQEGEEDMKHIDASERLPVEDSSSGKTYGAEGQVAESPVQPAEEEAPAPSTYFFFLRQSAPIVLNKAPLTANLMHREVWLLWLVCFASWSSMTLVSSNSSQVYQAVDYDHFSFYTNTVYVSIFGVASALGRVLVALHIRT
ncbi:hypothetical protein AGDE_09531 [Angomonas deanei]|nr:hypothetical protein AGDE_09531 [Angomonas deanei]|eukprot:EPY30264.1 hypothetical protein AGDE_09531 [Angomonas deanei]